MLQCFSVAASEVRSTRMQQSLLLTDCPIACPGRFFASGEIKLILSHILLHYDFETEVKGVRPKDTHLATECIPSETAKILFRKRMP